MSNFTKIFLILLLVMVGFYFRDMFYGNDKSVKFEMPKFEWFTPSQEPKEEKITDNTEKLEVPTEKEVEKIAKKEDIKPKDVVIVYFVTVDKKGNTWFAKSIKPLPKGQSKISYAMKNLIKGPEKGERVNGIYSEIPSDTKLLRVKETKDKIIVDVSSEFQYGGGADSLYSRVKQLIKTSLANSKNKPVYLYIDGKQANVIGGEGIMINQPLNENSLDE